MGHARYFSKDEIRAVRDWVLEGNQNFFEVPDKVDDVFLKGIRILRTRTTCETAHPDEIFILKVSRVLSDIEVPDESLSGETVSPGDTLINSRSFYEEVTSFSYVDRFNEWQSILVPPGKVKERLGNVLDEIRVCFVTRCDSAVLVLCHSILEWEVTECYRRVSKLSDKQFQKALSEERKKRRIGILDLGAQGLEELNILKCGDRTELNEISRVRNKVVHKGRIPRSLDIQQVVRTTVRVLEAVLSASP